MNGGSPRTQKKPKARLPPKRGLVMVRMFVQIVGWFKEDAGEGVSSEEDGLGKGSSASTTAPHSAYTSDLES
ncbi:hypothetical protein Sjap_013367 [Stephania japonica]|uniref:Uncharacterized protein n=1 Tax=Stephania japonica TaxID=461633 RepID=A0AAP0IYZ0_9MAGN